MIDYSISDPTKQIWTNLELYFETYDFYNFMEFSRIFPEFLWIYLELFSILSI